MRIGWWEDFNKVLDNLKCGGKRKSNVAMEEFQKVVSDMALVDVKLNCGWFIWSNNRRGLGLLRERLDRFLISSRWLSKVSFLASEVIHQAHSDNDMILLDSIGKKSQDGCKDPRLCFHFEEYWVKVEEVKNIIKVAWENGQGDVLKGCEKVIHSLGKWQYSRYKDRHGRIRNLLKEIDDIVDAKGIVNNTERLQYAERSWLASITLKRSTRLKVLE